ncbi:hypothetical protein ACHAXT_007843 [Thalassiosira profunda]
MNNRGGETGSPHVSMPLKGDTAKINPLGARASNNANVGGRDAQGEMERREMGHSPPGGNSRVEFATGSANQSSPMMPTMHPAETQDVGSHGLPQARPADTIFRDSGNSWSNVVSSTNSPPSPVKVVNRSRSGETLLTSNVSQPRQGLSPNAPHFVYKASSFDAGSADGIHQPSLGIPPSHPGGHHSYKGYPATPYHDAKHRSSMESYSPVSMGDSYTDKTSPMSSPSLSPYVSPSMNPRRHHGEPPTWSLSDGNDYHSETSPPQRLHLQLPQSIPEHQRHDPANPAHRGHHSYGPTSPPRHPPPGGGHQHHHSMYARRPGPKPHASSQVPLHHRSSMEVLKTLLRKKACLYEPETSFAVSLVTWLVGRRLALSQGYFTRQQLQAGVHACVARKIEEGNVTRTKVNRCMQVILNSCFHYIIPRPDGSEECGEAFRVVFSREAANEEHLLRTLQAPWNDLNVQAVAEDESLSSLFHDSDDEGGHPSAKPPRKDSSASQASDSLDSGGKRSVLLCFNENVRSAADVFRCHNEFIRDVAHTGHLTLSPEEWQAFFAGARNYRRRSASFDSYQPKPSHLAEMHDRVDRQGLSKLRTSWCAKRYDHDHAFCAFAHVDVNQGWLRRDPFVHTYQPTMCPYIKPVQGSDDAVHVNMCPLGVTCNHAHSKEEILYHPESYKKQPCRNAPGLCPLGDICPNAHAEASPHHYGYQRQGKRYHDHRSRRGPTAPTAHTSGFGKLPEGSPMLYIDPAPLSEFEKTLVLPGLQAIFRDHSSSLFYSSLGKSCPYEYGPFGYRNVRIGDSSDSTTTAPIGKL